MSKIGAAFVEVALKGLSRVQTDLAGVKSKLVDVASGGVKAFAGIGDKLTSIKKGFEEFRTVAAIAFGAATGSVLAFVGSADPKGMDDFKFQLYAIGLQIGRVFIPVIHDATELLSQLREWFESLTDAQRDNILHWAKITVVVAGIVLLVPKVIGAFQALGSAMTLFGIKAAIAWALATGGISLLITLIAAAIAAIVAFFSFENKDSGGFFGAIGQGVSQLWETTKAVFTAIAEWISGVFSSIWEGIKPVVDVVVEIGSVIFEVLGVAFTFLADLITATIVPVFKFLGSVISWVWQNVLSPVFSVLADALKWLANTVIDVINTLIRVANSILAYIPGTSYIGGRADYQIAHVGEGRREEEKKKEEAKQEEGRTREHTGQVVALKPEFVGIAEIARKLQTSQSQDLASRERRYQLDATNRGNTRLEEIRDRLPSPNAPNTGANLG
jgi:phage-related protein